MDNQKKKLLFLIVLLLKINDMQFKLLFLILLSLPASLPAKDGPETLAWVQQLGVKIENTLHDAILSNDWPNMLVKLMECHDEFDAIALVGLHCHEARIAAELGRNYCNWLNSYVRDKDLNACIIRAQAAREQAHRMIQAVKKALERLKIEAIQCQ